MTTTRSKTTTKMSTKKTPASKVTASITGMPFLAKLKPVDYLVAIVTVSLVGFGIWNLMNDPSANDDIACREPGTTQTVILQNDRFQPANITLDMCDRLQIINQDELSFDLAFGSHDEHQDYPGYSRTVVQPGEFIELDAIAPASLTMHDHLRDNAKLQFTVNEAVR